MDLRWISCLPNSHQFPFSKYIMKINLQNLKLEIANPSHWTSRVRLIFTSRLYYHVSHGNAVVDTEYFVNASCRCVKGCPECRLLIFSNVKFCCFKTLKDFLNLFIALTVGNRKQYFWRCHIGLWETWIGTCYYFLLFIQNNPENNQQAIVLWK